MFEPCACMFPKDSTLRFNAVNSIVGMKLEHQKDRLFRRNQDLVNPKFDSDFVNKSKIISTKEDKILDYKFIDVGFNGVPDDALQYIVRVEVVQFTDVSAGSYDLVKRQLDFHMHYDEKAGKYKIEGIWKKGETKLQNYEVFPGLTFGK